MNFTYQINTQRINVWRWPDDCTQNGHTSVTVYTEKGSFDRTIRSDNHGKFFTWNKEKIYLDSWMRISFNEFLNLVKNNKAISDDLCQMILTEGIDRNNFLCSSLWRRYSKM